MLRVPSSSTTAAAHAHAHTAQRDLTHQGKFVFTTLNAAWVNVQVSTTKGTGGDVIVLEEAAYCDPGFFYETIAPLMLIGVSSGILLCTLLLL